MPERVVYVIDKNVTDRDEAAAICAAVIGVLRPRLGAAQFDVYSDYVDEMPDAVREAEHRLEGAARRRLRTPPDPRMGLVVSPDQPEWHDFETYAAWSIDVDLRDRTGEWTADLNDSGYSVAVALTSAEADELRKLVEPFAPLELLSTIRLRQRDERRQRRWRAVRRSLRIS